MPPATKFQKKKNSVAMIRVGETIIFTKINCPGYSKISEENAKTYIQSLTEMLTHCNMKLLLFCTVICCFKKDFSGAQKCKYAGKCVFFEENVVGCVHRLNILRI